jgi:hypothetical protein
VAEKPPSRKVQAPRVRQQERRPTPDADRKRRMMLYTIAGSGLAGLAVVLVFLFLTNGGGTQEVDAALQEAGCTYETDEAQEAAHVAEDAKPKWNTDPPSSGAHFGIPAPFNFYDDPVDPIRVVHNLEHGGIVIYVGDDVPDAQVEAMRSWWSDDPNGVIVTPYGKLGEEIALTAWTKRGTSETAHFARCDGFDEKAFSTFRDELRANGPEPFPLDALAPGT